MEPTTPLASAGEGAEAKGWRARFHTQDIVLLAAVGGAMFAAAWTPAAYEIKAAVWAIGIITGGYVLLLRFLFHNPHASRFLPVRIAISLTLASIGFYFLHDLMHSFLLIFLFPILFYSTRFGIAAGIATAAASSLAVLGICLLKPEFAMETELPVTLLSTAAFLFTGTMAGMVTSELNRRNRELAARAEELEQANLALAEKQREVEQLNEDLRGRGRRLEFLATTDDLTGLANRRYFNEALSREFERAKRYGRELALLMLDVDGLKNVNDAHGHQFGDITLIGVADLLRQGLRATDLPARYGGDEFVALLPEMNGYYATQVVERIRASIGSHVFQHEGRSLQTSVSLGVGCYPSPGIGSESDLLRLADEALYKDKRRNKEGKRDGG